ncbi:MAG: hypothetical protein ACJAWV_001377 [Flammeovirgaceae bacterium]
MGGTFFVTYNLQSCVPKHLYKKWQESYLQRKAHILRSFPNPKEELDRLEKLEFAKRDNYFDSLSHLDYPLKQDAVAQTVADSLHYWHEKRIELYAYCIMPNHVHTVFRIFEEQEGKYVAYLQQVMKSIKSFSAKEANRVLNTSGQLWQSFHDGEIAKYQNMQMNMDL